MPDHKTSTRGECVLVLQGGGALGSYQAGVVEALAETGVEPAWVAGISIGAINAALIAGNPPERRLERMRMFWDRVTSGLQLQPWWPSDSAHAAFNELSAAWGTVTGAPGFFSQWFPPRALYPASAPGPVSYYDNRAAAPDPARARRFRPHQRPQDEVFGRRGQCRDRQHEVVRQSRS